MQLVNLSSISKIGFGGYRLRYANRTHREALHHAVDNGCTLFDTAPTYSEGESELLMGEVLAQSPHSSFVITKGGYGTKATLQNAPSAEVVCLDADTIHCIHPRFLDHQLALSSKRLCRDPIDGYLLHNPEYYFKERDCSTSEFMRRLGAALDFLERCVSDGRIRYYGISSNSFRTVCETATVNLPRLIALAAEVSRSHHFRLIEFPFNPIERTPALRPQGAAESVLEFAQRNGLASLGNRPLNAITPTGIIRLATGAVKILEDGQLYEQWRVCREAMARQLDKVCATESLDELEVVRLLDRHLEFSNVDSVRLVIGEHLEPLLSKMYGGFIPSDDLRCFKGLYSLLIRAAQHRMNLDAERLRTLLASGGLIDDRPEESLASLACKSCLRHGVHSVLAGMRTKSYVDDLKGLF